MSNRTYDSPKDQNGNIVGQYMPVEIFLTKGFDQNNQRQKQIDQAVLFNVDRNNENDKDDTG
ncbi:hypothetical protein D3C87_1141940 [compost metagenome]